MVEVVSVGTVQSGYCCMKFTEYVLLLINKNSVSRFQVNEDLCNDLFQWYFLTWKLNKAQGEIFQIPKLDT